MRKSKLVLVFQKKKKEEKRNKLYFLFFPTLLDTVGFLWAETRAELTYMHHTESTQMWNSGLKILNKS